MAMAVSQSSSRGAGSALNASTATAEIVAQDLTKQYGEFRAVKATAFSVPKGQIAAFLGPNGAGKSTTMKMLTGYLTPTSGSAWICGHSLETHRFEAMQKLGYLPENGPLYREMTPRGILGYCASVRGLHGGYRRERLDYVVTACDLSTVIDKPISKLSKGFRQRVGMAQAILHDPDVLILDEPTSGLDPNQTHQARELIRTLGKTKTILLSTHILAEVHAVCDRVLLITSGRVVLDGAVSELGQDVAAMEQKFRQLTTGS